MIQTTHLSADRLVVTDGRRQYRVHRPWARLPNGREFGRISQIAVARDGRVVVVQRDAPAVLLFAPDGELDNTWHHRKLDSVHGVAAAPDGSLLITSFDLHQVLRFDLDGHLLQELGTESGPRWDEPFNHPTDVAVDPRNGDLVVSDGYGNARLHRFDREGRLLHSWGEPGSDVGQFACPHGVWVMHDGRVVAVDRDNDRLQIFAGDGTFIEQWRGLCRPMDIWSDGETIFVSDQTPSVVALDTAGRVVGRARAFSVYPHGLWGDAEGNIFVAEQLPSGVAKYEVKAAANNFV
jgi:hypothetical protein